MDIWVIFAFDYVLRMALHGHPCTGFSVDIRPVSLDYIPRSGLGSHGSSVSGCFEEMADFAKGLPRSHPNAE